jgi:multisubunit Na+/H+ antiporter MnhE subunit
VALSEVIRWYHSGYKPRHTRFALFWTINWAILLGLWFLYTNTPKISELLVGAPAAALAASGMAVVQGQAFAQFAPKFQWLLLFFAEPWYVVTGSNAILWALLRRLTGKKSEAQLKAVPFPAGGDDHKSAARRALAIVLTTISPNVLVIGIDRRHHLMLVHEIAPTPTAWVMRQLGAAG